MRIGIREGLICRGIVMPNKRKPPQRSICCHYHEWQWLWIFIRINTNVCRHKCLQIAFICKNLYLLKVSHYLLCIIGLADTMSWVYFTLYGVEASSFSSLMISSCGCGYLLSSVSYALNLVHCCLTFVPRNRHARWYARPTHRTGPWHKKPYWQRLATCQRSYRWDSVSYSVLESVVFKLRHTKTFTL